jgi:hypothetical protein
MYVTLQHKVPIGVFICSHPLGPTRTFEDSGLAVETAGTLLGLCSDPLGLMKSPSGILHNIPFWSPYGQTWSESARTRSDLLGVCAD